MTRPPRFLGNSSSSSSTPSSSSAVATVAEPPEVVTVESDFMLILIALLCALMCVVGLIAVSQCAWLRRDASGNGGSSVAPNKGLKKKILQWRSSPLVLLPIVSHRRAPSPIEFWEP
ncbi:hypothetical protein U1Q18_035921 [Sarracenia purpurea var. burkii]